MSLHVPGAQIVQAPAPGPLYFPAVQVEQVALEVLPELGLNFPASQEVHAEALIAPLQNPGVQFVQEAAP